VTADFDLRKAAGVEPAGVYVGGEHEPVRAHLGRQLSGDRTAARADLKAGPASTHAASGKVSRGEVVEGHFEIRKPLLRLGRHVVEQVALTGHDPIISAPKPVVIRPDTRVQHAEQSSRTVSPTDDSATRACRSTGTSDTRRPVRVGELTRVPHRIVSLFGGHRLFYREPAAREPTVEVTHEALLVGGRG
jgi:hypothetical protein